MEDVGSDLLDRLGQLTNRRGPPMGGSSLGSPAVNRAPLVRDTLGQEDVHIVACLDLPLDVLVDDREDPPGGFDGVQYSHGLLAPL